MKLNLKRLYLLLSLGIIAVLASCSKKSADTTTDPNANFVTLPDTGLYYIKTGTVTVSSPDSTYSYDASKDFVAIYNTPTYYLIACNNLKNESLFIQSSVRPTTSTPNSLQLVQLTGVPLRLGYYYINPTLSNVGFATLSAYNTAGEAAAGSFTASLGRVYNNTYYIFVSGYTYAVSGTFDLKLNPK